ncbi:MAG: hypothetical protein JWL77_6108 [Chthonomonadaceae bacterium]|nr:hypothetical protein [Chthonomonadaceae bacterium]
MTCLPAYAQFVPDRGSTASHWKEPIGGLDGYHWLNDREVLYTQHSTPSYRYFKWNVTTGAEQDLQELTRTVHESLPSIVFPPRVFPSPNGRYVAWISSNNGGAILLVSSIEGSVITSHTYQTCIHYPCWSEDSQRCFCFLDGIEFIEGDAYTAITDISAISMNMPFAVKTHPIVDGGLRESTDAFLPVLSNMHFKGSSAIFVIVKDADDSTRPAIEEYKFTDSAKSINNHTVDMPSHFLVINAIISPTGDFVAWRFRNEDAAEIWISDVRGKNMVRLGRLLQKETVLPGVPGRFDRSELQWLPSGKGISFREAGELWVAYPNIRVHSN